MAVCPAYRAGRREELVARGKLRLLQGVEEGGLAPDRRLSETLSRCLLCGRCQANCPNSVAATEGLMAGRAAVAARAGTPFLKRLLLNQALPRPRRLELAAAAGRLAQRAVPAESGLWLRLPGLARARFLPQVAARPYLREAPREVAGPAGAPRVGLFVGCVANHLRPELAAKAARLLSRRFTVVTPPGQGCCGLPALAAGLEEPARSLAERHLELFGRAGVEMVVTACGSCAHTLAAELPRLTGDRGRELAGRVREISQVLAEETSLLRELGPAGAAAAAVHDPCHLALGMGVTAEPRRVLEAAGVELAPMSGADQCCGGGGLFAVNEPELSRAIFQPRAEALAASGAGVLATSCSGCHLQWPTGLEGRTPVAHPIELLAG
jgi:glycolate oxidase iron-sulfur subunit